MSASNRKKPFKVDRDAVEWTGPTVRYDIAKEITVCFVIVLLLVLACAAIFSSPDDPPVTLKSWSTTMPVDFAQTAATELAGTSATATYGPPYTNTKNVSQKIGPISLETIPGRTIPIDTAQDFVIKPLLTLPDSPQLDAAIATYEHASAAQRTAWSNAFAKVVAKAHVRDGRLAVASANDGPVPEMIGSLLSMARSGALDGALLSSPQLYGTNYTKPLLFIADGNYLNDLATVRHLQGGQWGMMNETGNYPGQAWLWLYTFWYQVPPYSTSASGDALVWGTMMILTLLLALVPFIPGLRSIPRWTRVYRLIWRRHYASQR